MHSGSDLSQSLSLNLAGFVFKRALQEEAQGADQALRQGVEVPVVDQQPHDSLQRFVVVVPRAFSQHSSELPSFEEVAV